VSGVNRVGADGNGVAHAGESIILDPAGKTLLKGTPNRAFVKTLSLSKSHLQQVRRRLPFLADADRFRVLT
jgi:predicted amidohydrolase